MTQKTFAFSGHRPPKTGGYGHQPFIRLTRFVGLWIRDNPPDRVIIGMAQGWDQAVAVSCMMLGIPYIAAVPFRGQELGWPSDAQDKYRWILHHAAEVHYISSGGYFGQVQYHKRNAWMVDNCDRLIALWDGSPSGTGNCVQYANSVGKQVINLWSEWTAFSA